MEKIVTADYTLQWLSNRLVYIQWLQTPTEKASIDHFIHNLTHILDSAAVPIYFIADLRRGRISHIQALKSIAMLIKHRNWGGGAAFSDNPITKIYIDTVRRLAATVKVHMGLFRTPEQAIAYLQSLSAQICDDQGWDSIVTSVK